MIDESKIPIPEKAPADFPRLHDVDYFYERLTAAFERVCSIRPYKIKSLGQLRGHDMLLLTPETFNEKAANSLIASGFHGEEPGGPWGVVEFLETAPPELILGNNQSYIPLVSPTAFEAADRFNYWGENSNRGFIAISPEIEKSVSGNNKYPSREGLLLIDALDDLMVMGRDAVVCQHEDWRMHDAFTFINERASMPSPFAQAIIGALAKHFNIASDDDPLLAGTPIRNGIWHNDLDGSFESLMMFYGTPLIATPETPGQKSATSRIAANRDVTQAVAKFMLR